MKMMLRKLTQSLLAATAAMLTLTSAQGQTLSSHWTMGYRGPNQPLVSTNISEPGTMQGTLLGGGIYAETGGGYAWMEGINAFVGAPGYSPGENRGTLGFRMDRIDFTIDTPTTAVLSSEFFFEAEGDADALLEFSIAHFNSSNQQQGSTKLFRDRGNQTGVTATSTPWQITLNPGDYLRIQNSTLRVLATTWDLNHNGFEDSSDTFYSRVVVSFGLKIDTDADFTSELGGFYTGAMPLSIPEPSTYALLGVFCFVLTTLRRHI